ncbi:MAG: hypothetical protein P8103_19515 [Candidatus Thiodiazotropha sp.]
MSNLTIKDLESSHELDRAAASAIMGGINEWIRIPTLPRPATPTSICNIYNIDYDYTMINPQFFNIGNGVTNSGTIVYDVDPMLLSAASPVNAIA